MKIIPRTGLFVQKGEVNIPLWTMVSWTPRRIDIAILDTASLSDHSQYLDWMPPSLAFHPVLSSNALIKRSDQILGDNPYCKRPSSSVLESVPFWNSYI